jgi:hypothetical protein
MTFKEAAFHFFDDLRAQGEVNIFEGPRLLRMLMPEVRRRESYDLFKQWTDHQRDQSRRDTRDKLKTITRATGSRSQ